jgi:hypothetical protein
MAEKKEVKTIGLKRVLVWIFSIIFIIVGFISFVSSFISGIFYLLAGIVLLPPANNFVKKKYNFQLSIWLKILIVIFLLILAGVTSGIEKVAQNLDSENLATTDNSNALTTEQLIKQDVQKILGSSNRDVEVVREITLTDFEGEKWLYVSYNANDNLASSWISRGFSMDAIDIFEKIFTDYQEVGLIVIYAYFPLSDKYGNVEDVLVSTITMERATANKINWDNLLTENLPSVADGYSLHQAFK